MRIAIEGCGHGTLHAIYASIQQTCQVQGWNGVDLAIIGGDFQAVRNSYDLNCMSVPQKYRAIGDFHEYYSGRRTAPYLTLFVGGNHEASSHLHELYHGGWVAPGIYYLGAANVVRFGDLRIAGLSGIWKGYNYQKSHFERVPYTPDETKSFYHVREIDVRKLLLIREQVDVGLSHDWPRGIEWHGDHKSLFKKKDLFEADAKAGTLGSAAAKYIMDRLRPPYWFAAHLHCKFAAVVNYETQTTVAADGLNATSKEVGATNGTLNEDEIDVELNEDGSTGKPSTKEGRPIKNEDEIDLDMDDDSAAEPTAPIGMSVAKDAGPSTKDTNEISAVPADLRAQLPASFTRPRSPPPTSTYTHSPAARLPPPPTITNTRTSFLALDKCLPNRRFLQLMTIDPLSSSSSATSPPALSYDPEWLSILRVFGPHDPHKPAPHNMGEAAYMSLIATEREWVEDNIVKPNKLAIPENFELTAPVYDGGDIRSVGGEQPKEYSNPQTQTFCDLLGMRNWFNEEEAEREERRIRKEAIVRAEVENSSGGRGRGGGGSGRGGGGRGRGGNGRFGGRGDRGRGRGWR